MTQYKNSQHKDLTEAIQGIRLQKLMADYPSMMSVDIAELISAELDRMRIAEHRTMLANAFRVPEKLLGWRD